MLSAAVDAGVEAGALPAVDGYQVLELLGEGGSGRVFKAVRTRTGQLVALKLLHPGEQRTAPQLERMAARFERETQLGAQLHHPHIVALLDKGSSGAGQHYAVFEYVPGETLKNFLVRKGPLAPAQAGDLMGQVLDALACAHAQGITHRDLKPQNIMLSATGARLHVKILDFGIAAFIPARQSADYRQLTLTSEMLCSPSYSAPEQLRGEAPTVKIDLYAWGLLFVECLTGRPAIEGATLADIFHQQLSSTEVPLPSGLLGHPLGDLLRRALKKNPQERAHSATALHHDFQQINLGSLVGPLEERRAGPPGPDTAPTREYLPGQMGLVYQRQQISVLSCTLDLVATDGAAPDLEALEALQRDQLSTCTDSATRYGAHLAGALGNSLLFYFGYPHHADDDARRCARTALELSGQMRRRNGLLTAQGVRMDLRIGIHSGIVHILPGQLPSGVTPNTAMLLERHAAAGEVLVSGAARQLLAPYVDFKPAAERGANSQGAPLPCFSMLGEHAAETSFLMRSGQSAPPMVGRAEESGVLAQAWAEARAGRGRALLLQGEAGIGKSRLAYTLCAQARHEGALVLEARCLPEHQNNALHAVLALLEQHLALRAVAPAAAVERVRRALERAALDVRAVLPILCSWLALPIAPDYPALQFSPERQKAVLLAALCDLLLSLGDGQTQEPGQPQARPCVLVFEDVHWIDHTGRDLLGLMLATLAQHPVLLLITARPHFTPPWPALEQLPLGRLSEAAAGQLVRAILGAQAIDAAALHRLCRHTDGVPLFIAELTRMLLDKGAFVERNGVHHLEAELDGGDIPATLRDLLSARLARLSSARETAQLAAALGRQFDYALLQELALVDEASLQTDLEQLLAADLLSRHSGVQGDTYLFRHALIRDAAYDGMPQRQRQQTHARIAAHMERSPPDAREHQLAPLARHFALALQYDKAVDYGTRSAAQLLQRALADEAVAQADLVLGLIVHLEPPMRAAAEMALNPILTNAYMSKFGWADERVKHLAEHALRLAGDSQHPQQTLPLLWSLTAYHHCTGQRAGARTLIGQLYGLAHQSGDDATLVACRAIDGITLWVDGDYVGAREALGQVLRQDGAGDAPLQVAVAGLDARVWAMAGMGCLNWFMLDDDVAAFEQGRAAVAYARERNHMPSLGVALMYQAYNYHYAGDCTNAFAVAREMRQLAQQYGLPAIEAYGAVLHAWSVSDLALADQVLENLRKLGLMLGMTCLGAVPAEIEARAGNFAQAYQRIDACLALADAMGEHYFDAELLLRRAMYRNQCAFADARHSRADLCQAIALAQRTGMRKCEQRASAQLLMYS